MKHRGLIFLTAWALVICCLIAKACPVFAESSSAPPSDKTVSAGGDPSENTNEAWVPAAKGYVLVSAAMASGWLALPDEEETVFPLTQVFPDGSETLNLIHLTPEGVYMEDSTCENHDCVEQGIVTLENRMDRILSNMIICLPNQVILELYSPEEVLEMVRNGMPAPIE